MAKSSEEVEREVEATRGEIDRTVEALKEKMQPKELFEEATRVMGGASNKVLTTVVEQARENPLPIALIGLGVAWLALSQRKSRQFDPYSGAGYYETYEGYDENGGRRLTRRVTGALEAAKGRLAEAKDKVAGRLDEAKEGLAHGREEAMEGAEGLRGRISGFTHACQAKAGDVSRQAQARFQDTLDHEPLILGAVGLAVGAAIGASLPASRVENRYVGPMRDKLVGRGREMAQSSLHEARTVAERAYGQVKEELHRQTGPEGEGTTLQEKAEALADAGAQAVRDEVEARTH